MMLLHIEMKVGCCSVQFFRMLSEPVLDCPKQELWLCNLGERTNIDYETQSSLPAAFPFGGHSLQERVLHNGTEHGTELDIHKY